MRLTIDDEAQDEARQHVEWYAARNPRAAARLAELFIETLQRVVRHPLQFALMEGENRNDVRRARLDGFPIIVIYQLLDDEVFVVAIAHTSRQPGYWRARLRREQPPR
jgi:toxin ParE1/3/4